MAHVKQLIVVKTIKPEPLSAGKLSLLTFIHERIDVAKNQKFPKIVSTAQIIEPFKITDSWNFDVSIESLNKNY